MEHMGFDFLVIFYKMFEGINHHDTLPEKKNAPEDWWLEEDTFPFLEGGFFLGANSLFSRSGGLRIHSSSLESTLEVQRNHQNPLPRSLIGRISEMKKPFGESFWQENVPIVLQVYGFDQENYVDGCIKPCNKRVVWSTC